MYGIMEVTNLCKTYGKGRDMVRAVDGITLSVKKGEIFGLLGPNGAGKTTTLKMMIGLLQPDNGEVSILNMDPFTSSIDYKRQVSIIPQEIVMYPDLTVEENLWFVADIYDIPRDIAQLRIDHLLDRLDLASKRQMLVRKLSGGLQRRLNLILGLVSDAQIILCDEPTPGLDPQSRVAVWEFIQSLPEQGKTVILTTHFMEEADRLCDRVAIIDEGKILILDTPSNLKKSIGEGDMVEISLVDQSKLADISDMLSKEPMVKYSTVVTDTIVVQGLDLVSHLNTILSKVERITSIRDLKLRKTSLEDVFIELTGKRLRD